MAYVSPSTQLAGDLITTGIWNQNVVENSKASAPDVFTTKGDIFAATGADAGARLAPSDNAKVLTLDDGETTGLKWDWAGGGTMPNHIISSIGPHCLHVPPGVSVVGGNGGSQATTTAWGTANAAFFVPMEVPRARSVTHAWCYNGSTVAGNWEIGVYDVSGNLLSSTGSIAMSGASAPQSTAFSITLDPNVTYFLAMAMSNNTATLISVSYPGAMKRAQGTYQMATAFPLPAVATFAAPSLFSDTMVIFGLATDSRPPL